MSKRLLHYSSHAASAEVRFALAASFGRHQQILNVGEWIGLPSRCAANTLTPKRTKQKLLILFDSLLANSERVDA